MKDGALAMFDALGFKGIWNRPEIRDNPLVVIEKLAALEVQVREGLKLDLQGAAENTANILSEFRLLFLSDTVVIGIKTKDAEHLANHGIPEAGYRHWSLVVLARYVSMVMRNAAMTAPALTYRGCITFGKFAIEENIIIGPAVDEAADSMDAAQGSFVWLAPSAAQRLDRCNLSVINRLQYSLVPYLVPLKGGSHYQTHAVSPFDIEGRQPLQARDGLNAKMLETFTDSIDVQIKKQNTARFLQHASVEFGKVCPLAGSI